MKIHALKLFTPLLALVLAAGCTSIPEDQEGEAAAEGALVESRETEGAITRGAEGQGAWTGSALDDPSSPLSSRTLYFDLDSSDIRSEYIDILRAHAEYLAANPTARITLEGHADERGTREYNLALGERRALVVRRFLMAEGVGNEQLQNISYGEERPVDAGGGEAAWARNRRVEMVY